ncbi:HAD family hydrolase [Candidatus Omnitrophota bacterium]
MCKRISQVTKFGNAVNLRKSMESVDTIIFDVDGTLIDSRQDIANAVNFALKKAGLQEKSITQISSYIGMGVEDLISRAVGQQAGALFKKALTAFEAYYRKHSADNSVLYPGVKEVLEYYKEKRKVVITNRNYEFAVSGLKAAGIYAYFEDIIGGDDAACMKPSSCPLDKFMHGLDIDKARAIIVGDMDIDVLAGKRAGILTCAVTYGIGRREDILKAKPDYVIGNLRQLKEIIN